MSKILVTGASGFVGRALCTALVRRGHQVRAAVRSLHRTHIWEDSITTFEADLADFRPDIWRYQLSGVDILIHLAACAHQNWEKSVQHYQKVNTDATARLCRLSTDCNIRRFVFLSSVKVCGETSDYPLSANDTPSPQDLYALSKWNAEQQVRAITQGCDCEYVILRPPLVYGPYVRANFLKLLKLAALDIPLPLGSFHNRRSMIYIGNLTDAIIHAMQSPDAAGQVFMLSDGRDLTVAALIKAISMAMGQQPKIFPFPPRGLRWIFNIAGRGALIDKLQQPLTVDTSKIREALGWRPPYSVEEGLQATVDWFKGGNAVGDALPER